MYPGERLNGYSHLLGLVLALVATVLFGNDLEWLCIHRPQLGTL